MKICLKFRIYLSKTYKTGLDRNQIKTKTKNIFIYDLFSIKK